MHDQAAELRQLVRERSAGLSNGPSAPLVVVSGGKGDVGSTTIAANLAIALARQGRRAVFVDADLDHGGNANLACGTPRGSVLDVLAGRLTVHESLDRGPSGIQVLSGDWASGQPNEYSSAAEERFLTELRQLAPHADVVVLDAGSGRAPLVRRLWRTAEAVVVVTTAESSAVMNAYAAVKALAPDERPATIHVLVNRSSDVAAAADVQTRIATACRKFLALACGTGGQVPECNAASDHEGVLIFPARSDAARALDRIGDTLWAQLQVGTARRSAASRTAEAVG